MTFREALSYSEAAGLDAKFGLYSAFFGPLVYTIFGGSKYANFGPTLVSCNLMRSFIAIPGKFFLSRHAFDELLYLENYVSPTSLTPVFAREFP